MPKAVVTDEAFNWATTAAERALADTVIYEPCRG